MNNIDSAANITPNNNEAVNMTNSNTVIENTNENSGINLPAGDENTESQKEVNVAGSVTEPAACTSLAIQENSNLKEKSQIIGNIRVVPCKPTDTLSLKVPENEKAVESGENTDRMKQFWGDTSLPPVWNMANIQGVMEDRIFAGIRENDGGIRSIEFVQRYSNGSFSPKMKISQADIMMSQIKTGKKIARFEEKVTNEYLGKFRGDPREILDIREIIKTLFIALPALPMQSDDYAEFKRRQFYFDVMEIVSTSPCRICDDNRAYYPLIEEEILDIAQNLKMTKLDLLRKLRDYGFLYLTNSSTGYQTNIRCTYPDKSTYTTWRYCLYKINYFTGMDEDPDHTRMYDF